MASIRCLGDAHGEKWAAYHGDCVDVVAQLPDNSVGFSVYSPPFSNLFVYSDSLADMGNNASDGDFFQQYQYLLREMARVTMPGRLSAVHCSDLPLTKWKDGMIGIKDLSGDIIRAHQEAGWILHSRVTIWKCPVVEMTRTKALGLLYKQLQKDSTRSRQGMADYLLVFRAPGENSEPVSHRPPISLSQFIKDETIGDWHARILAEGRDPETDDDFCRAWRHMGFSVDQWQKWASPVWMDIRQTNTLNVAVAREDKDEKHLCPLQLDLIERALILWSNPNDIVLSPFMGIGSEGYVALKSKRRFVGVELKEAYFKQASKHLTAQEAIAPSLFDTIMAAD